jgi:hypothetical protein
VALRDSKRAAPRASRAKVRANTTRRPASPSDRTPQNPQVTIALGNSKLPPATGQASLTRKRSLVQSQYRPRCLSRSEASLRTPGLAFLIICHQFVIKTRRAQMTKMNTWRFLAALLKSCQSWRRSSSLRALSWLGRPAL